MFTTNIRFLAIFFLVTLSFNLGSGLKCYKCNSKDLAECATSPSNELPVEECPGEDTECVMAVFDDMVTYRGCKSSVQISEDCTHCLNATCTDDLCNGGLYPENRLKCHQCQREECVTVLGQPEACQNYDRSDFCYIDVIDETDVIRGCISDSDYDAGVYTVFCRTDGCNNAPAVSEFSCISCDSEKDKNCKSGNPSDLVCEVNATNVCTVDVLYGRRESCYTFHDGLRIIRGCNRLDPEIVMQTKYVTICRQNKCNNACLTSPMCYVCDSKEDEDCYSDQTALTPQDCPVETSSCYTCKNDDDSVIRGCSNATAFQGICEYCSETRGCNSKEILACYNCDSNSNDNCATWIHDEYLDFQVCPSTCLAKVTENGQTIRGCKSENLSCNENDLHCLECDDLICNGGTFPKTRLKCYQCSENDTFCDKLPYSRAYACPIYDADEGCYQFLSDARKMVRGCKSDKRYDECKQNGDRCIECSGSECNNLPIQKPNSFSCMVCEDSKECPWAQLHSKSCISNIPYYTEPACFTKIKDTDIVVRGCLGDGNDCDPLNDETCELCTPSGCNRDNKVFQNCVQCSTENKEDPCAGTALGINATRCPNDVQHYDRRGCYVMKKGAVISRGCINELDESTYAMCVKDNQSCSICLTQNCNYQKAPNAAGTIGLSHILGFTLVIFAFGNF